MYQILRHRLLGQEQLEDRVAVHRHGFEHLLPGVAGLAGHRRGNRLAPDRLAVGTVEVNRLFGDQVDHPGKIPLPPDRKLQEHRVAAEPLAELLGHAQRVGPHAIELVDERQPRDVVAPQLAVDGQRLGLHAADAAEHQHRPVQHAEAPLHLDGEIDVAGRVDQIDRGIAPLDRGGGAGDRDPALPLQFHVVHRGPGVVDLAHAVDAAGVEQDPLAQRGLARVDVGGNADIA